jgi:hypothetical protein
MRKNQALEGWVRLAEHTTPRAWAIVLAAALVVVSAAVLAWDLLGLPGSQGMGNDDFLAFYSAGRLVLEGHATSLHDQAALRALQFGISHREVGAAGYMPYLNPPFFALAMSPLALVSEPAARALWFLLNVGLAIYSAFSITRGLRGRARTVGYLLVLGSVPVYWALSEGQVSILMLAAALQALGLARARRPLAAGAWLSVLWLKPHLAVLALVGLLVCGRRREALGMMAVVVGVTAASLLVIPFAAYSSYVAYLLDVLVTHVSSAGNAVSTAWSGPINTFQGINGLTNAYLPGAPALVVTSLAALVGAALAGAWLLATRTVRPGVATDGARLMLAATIMLALLLDPHLYNQDTILALLAAPVLMAGRPRLLPLLAIVGLTDSVLVDQAVLVHPFPWLCLLFTVAVLWRPALATAMRLAERPRTLALGQRATSCA